MEFLMDVTLQHSFFQVFQCSFSATILPVLHTHAAPNQCPHEHDLEVAFWDTKLGFMQNNKVGLRLPKWRSIHIGAYLFNPGTCRFQFHYLYLFLGSGKPLRFFSLLKTSTTKDIFLEMCFSFVFQTVFLKSPHQIKRSKLSTDLTTRLQDYFL